MSTNRRMNKQNDPSPQWNTIQPLKAVKQLTQATRLDLKEQDAFGERSQIQKGHVVCVPFT